MNSLPMFPAVFIDMTGSLIIIALSFMSLRYAYLLTRKQPDNFLWGFLFYFCMTLAAFSISRAAGHLLKQILLISGNKVTWKSIAPFSGGFNSLLMISLSAVTIYYHKGIEGYRAIEQKAGSLKKANDQLEVAADELQKMNLHLEEMVEERTAELTVSEKKFRNFFINSKDMVYFCDSANQLVDMNVSGLKMLGYPPDTPPALDLKALFLNTKDLDAYFETVISKGFVEDLEVEFSRADGSVIYVLLSATAVFDDDHNFVGCEGIAKDLTRVRTMMEQLATSEKMASVGQMAAGVAHEINTPLGVILGYSQLMMDDFAEDSEETENLHVIERQTKACRKIVADLLKFSRQSQSARENIALNEVISDVLAVTEHFLSMDHITIHRDLSDDLPEIIGDTEKLRQVFVNFVNNAHHAMEKQGGGDIYISTKFDEAQGLVVATVRDTGHGIDEDVKAKIFDPFFTTKSVGKGTGLGLSVSYGIIQEHNGVIEVESPPTSLLVNRHREGTAFHVKLPAARKEPASVKV
ncbi:MAG: ATP-binding protein [Thermodesulfobacteriota bacterium]